MRFNDLLQRWNAVYNLTAVRDSTAALSLHVIDAWQLYRRFASRWPRRMPNRSWMSEAARVAGVIFAITNPAVRVTCVDAVGKKSAFVTQVAGELGLQNLNSVHRRAEELNGQFSVIASRAFSSLQEFVRITRHLRSPEGVWMAMKGKLPSEEMEELSDDVSVFHVEHLDVPGLSVDRCLVWMRSSAAINQPESR